MQGPYTQSYQPLGDLVLTFEHGVQSRDYRRQLDLQSAIADVRYRIGDATYMREVFASAPRSGDRRAALGRPAGVISFTATLDSLLRHDVQQDGDVLKLVGTRPRARRPELLRQRQDPDRLS